MEERCLKTESFLESINYWNTFINFLLFLGGGAINWTNMEDKYQSKLSPIADLWAGIYLVFIGKYQKYI